MEATLTGSATATPRRTILFVLVAANLACAPWSWIVDGLTPSWVVYPIVLLVGLRRMRRGGATLYFAIAAAVFFLVHPRALTRRFLNRVRWFDSGRGHSTPFVASPADLRAAVAG